MNKRKGSFVNSKFIGKVYDGYQVVHAYVNKQYSYKKDNGKFRHASYNYVLVNYENRDLIVLTGNCMGPLLRGERRLVDILNPNPKARGSKNSYINSIIQKNKVCGR